MIRFGLLGCGRIAKRHADWLGGGHIDGARLVAVCDVVPERASPIGNQFGVPAFDRIDDFLTQKDIDAVAILSPSGLHHEHAIAAARAGKHVVVEKPMALRLEDADAMIRACDEAGVKLFVVKQNRFNVPVVKAREALACGVQTAVNYPVALPFLEAYRRLRSRPEQFPNAYRHQGRILSLPMFAEITAEQQHTVVDRIRAFG